MVTYDQWNFFRRNVARAGGATLGYITAGVPGAYWGAKGMRKVADVTQDTWLNPGYAYGSSPKKIMPYTPPRTPRKRRRPSTSGGYGRYVKARRLSTRKRHMQPVAAKAGRRVAKGTRQANKRRVVARKKPIRVSRRLSKKIKKVIDNVDDKATGTFYRNELPGVVSQLADNKTTVIAFPGNRESSGTEGDQRHAGELFTANVYLDAVSKLFNAKPQTEVREFFDTNNFKPANAFFNITWAKARFNLKNNSERVFSIKMYVCKSKQQNISNTQSANPGEHWETCVKGYDINSVAANTPKSFTGFDMAPQFSSNGTRWAVNYCCDPRLYPTFNERWTTTCTKFVLGPGQVAYRDVYGPVGEMNMNDVLASLGTDSVQYQVNHKDAIYVMFAIDADIIQVGNATTPGEGEAYYDVQNYGANDIVQACIIECKTTIKAQIPMRTLGLTTDTERTRAKTPRIFYEEFYRTEVNNQQVDVDPQQPLGAT